MKKIQIQINSILGGEEGVIYTQLGIFGSHFWRFIEMKFLSSYKQGWPKERKFSQFHS